MLKKFPLSWRKAYETREECLSFQINAGTQGTARDLLAAQETALQQEDPLGPARGEIR